MTLKKIANYISEIFLDDDLVNKVAFEMYTGIRKLSYLGPMLGLSENEKLASKGIHHYVIRSYVVYYVLDDAKKIVKVLRIKHKLQDENKFFGYKV